MTLTHIVYDEFYNASNVSGHSSVKLMQTVETPQKYFHTPLRCISMSKYIPHSTA